jgi:hypothetical protein
LGKRKRVAGLKVEGPKSESMKRCFAIRRHDTLVVLLGKRGKRNV